MVYLRVFSNCQLSKIFSNRLIEKKILQTNGPVQFETMLFRSHLYCLCGRENITHMMTFSSSPPGPLSLLLHLALRPEGFPAQRASVGFLEPWLPLEVVEEVIAQRPRGSGALPTAGWLYSSMEATASTSSPPLGSCKHSFLLPVQA